MYGDSDEASRDSDFSSDSDKSGYSDEDFSADDRIGGATKKRQDKYDRKQKLKDYSSDSDIEVTHKGPGGKAIKVHKDKESKVQD